MSHSSEKLTEYTLKLIRKDIAGKKMIYHEVPRCRECDCELQVGDTMDGKYPYFTEHNLCGKCESEDIKGKKRLQWNTEMLTAKPTDNAMEMWFAKELVKDLCFELNQGGQNLSPFDQNRYAVGYWDGLLQRTMSLIVHAPISKEAWQAAGLTYELMEMCNLEVKG